MRDSLELELSLLVCLLLSGVYVGYMLLAEPSGGHPFGHAIGIAGTGLMVATETLYSVRKRARWLGWAGPLRYWLSFHIFTGLVGPFMVLMHTAFAFRGLAGFTWLLTMLVVASGFLGRYFYTAIPRSLAGAEATAVELAQAAVEVQASLNLLVQQRSAAVRALVAADATRLRAQRADLMLVVLRGWDDWRYRRQLRQAVRRLEKTEQRRLTEVERLLARRRALERQSRTLESARRLLSAWHVAHVPMGLALFGSVAIHIAATFYFRAGLW
jgi:hypothetical protein